MVKKTKINKYLSFFIALILIISIAPVAQATEDFQYVNELKNYIIGNPADGDIYFEHNAVEPTAIASITKLMTYYVVMDDITDQKYDLTDIVTIDEEAASYAAPGNSHMGLKVNEQVSVEDLLKGILVVSANDGAVALAKHSAGSQAAFANLMNTKAKELGLETADFINPTGLSVYDNNLVGQERLDNAQYSKLSLRDLFKLTSHIVETYPEIYDITSLDQLILPDRNYVGNISHTMFQDIPSLVGLKSGMTYEAGYAFDGIVDMSKVNPEQNYNLVIIFTGAANAEARIESMKELINYASNNLNFRDLVNYEAGVAVTDYYSSQTLEKSIPLYVNEGIYKIVGNNVNRTVEIDLTPGLEAPFEDGQVMGEMTVFLDGNEAGKVDLINKGYKAKLGFMNALIESAKDFINSIMLLF